MRTVLVELAISLQAACRIRVIPLYLLFSGTALAQPHLNAARQDLGVGLQLEPCIAQIRADSTGLGQDDREFALECGTREVGALWQLSGQTAGIGGAPSTIEHALHLPALESIRGTLSCATGEAITEGQTALAPCRLRSGGWPALLAVGRSTKGLRVAYGPPTALPAVLNWISDRQPTATDRLAERRPAATERHAFTPVLERLFKGRVPLASASDVARLSELARDARVANSEGRDADAEAMLRELLSQQRKLLSEFDTATAQTLLELALSVANQGRVLEAESLMRAAEPILERAPSPAERARLNLYRGLVAAGAGAHEAAMRYATAAAAALRPDEAGNALAEVLAAAQSDPSQPTAERAPPGALIIALNLQAAMALRTGAIEVADAAASEALRLIDALPDAPPAWRPEILLTLGRVSSAKGRISAAETYLTTALAFQRANIGDGQRSLAILAALGEAYEREAMYTSALVTFRDFAALLDRWSVAEPPRIPDEWLLPFARATAIQLPRLTEAEAREALLAEAFELLQRALPERLAITGDQIARERERIDPDYAKLRETLRTALRARDLARLSLAIETRRPDRSRSRIAEERLEAEDRDAQLRYDAARRSLALRHSAVQDLILRPSVPARAVRAQLLPDEALIQYLIGENDSFAVVVRNDRIELIALPTTHRAALNADISELRMGLEGAEGPARPFDLALARRLTDQLVAPLTAALEGARQLQVVTGGALSALPFALLTDPGQSTAANAAPRWLVERFAISHTPSVAVFHSQRSQSRAHGSRARPALAIGISRWNDLADRPPKSQSAAGPAQPSDDRAFQSAPRPGGDALPTADAALERLSARCQDGPPLDAALLASLPPLPGITRELSALSTVLGARGTTLKKRIDQQATEQSFRSETLSRYGLLYFATHAVLPGATRCLNEPALALTTAGGNGSRADDGLLEAREVSSLRLEADLVVLSACNTATRAQALSGESLTGLAQAFFSAGARRVLATHWPVDSRRTAELMESLFSSQRQSDYSDVTEALREAQIRMLRAPDTQHPWFWAGFMVLGTGPVRAAN